jgi:aconitase B
MQRKVVNAAIFQAIVQTLLGDPEQRKRNIFRQRIGNVFILEIDIDVLLLRELGRSS